MQTNDQKSKIGKAEIVALCCAVIVYPFVDSYGFLPSVLIVGVVTFIAHKIAQYFLK